MWLPRSEVRLDVRSVENRLGVLPGDRAAPAVRIEKARPERALAFSLSLCGQHDLPVIGRERLEWPLHS